MIIRIFGEGQYELSDPLGCRPKLAPERPRMLTYVVAYPPRMAVPVAPIDNGVTSDWSARWRCRRCHPLLKHPAVLDKEQREFDSLDPFSSRRYAALYLAVGCLFV